MSEAIKTLGKNGLEINEYKGEFSLIATYEGKDGKSYRQWGKPKIGKTDYGDKDRPFKIILGDKLDAERALLKVLREITGLEYSAGGNEQAPF